MKRFGKLLTMVLTCVLITWGVVPMVIGAETQKPEMSTEASENPEDFIFELTQPGPEIKRLEALAGTWSTAIKVWADGEDAPAYELSGTAERKWILGGRYLEEITENATSDGVYQGRGYFGYNRAQGLYEGVWISTEDVEVSFDKGRIDPETNALVLQGGYVDAAAGYYIFRTTEFVIDSPDRHVMTIYLTDVDGRSYKSAEIAFTRK